MSNQDVFSELLQRRVLVLDGAMGTLVQRRGLEEKDYRNEALRDHPGDLKGNADLLSLTRPDVIGDIHDLYLQAGADLIETNTFSAQAISQADYHLQDLSYDLNVASARIAKERAEAWTRKTPNQPRFVAGSIGPTNRTLSLSPKVEDPGFRSVTWAEVRDAYRTQVRGLLDGGSDLLLCETVFDTLNLKACLFAIEQEFVARNQRVPVMISVTITDKSGRTLSGQTIDAFWASVAHAKPFSVGINCALGAREMRPFLQELAHNADCWLSAYPNAGLPNAFGGYDQQPAETAELVGGFVRDGLAQIVGGCCGTTPDHIAALAASVARDRPCKIAVPNQGYTRLSGLEGLMLRPDSNFTLIGERTNVTGSKRFADLIKARDFATALDVARDQVRGGANLLDVNMDEGMLDSEEAMHTFLNLVASEPDIARLPIMVDSSKWSVLEVGLQCLQGKGVCNSLSLKEGPAEFLQRARLVQQYGAAVVVMAFDEQGQADTTDRRIEICQRAYDLLTEQAGFAPCDIFFDLNVLAIGTGIEEHNDYAVSFLQACREVKRRMPGVHLSGGVSNLSFAFRGNNIVREAMNAAFLYHAIAAGLDMGIVNAGQLAVYQEIEPELLVHVEDVVLNRRPDATERLVSFAERVKGSGKARVVDLSWRDGTLDERIRHAMVTGQVDFIGADLGEALELYDDPLKIIEGPMMAGMAVVGDLFGAGKMFLPQVVKSARVMKKGVAFLEPYLEARKAAGLGGQAQGRILLATVKGDVHDIGKNIVGVVLGCNNYHVIDLGVMVPMARILDEAVAQNADIIGLSGLITPSLDEMVQVAKEMQRRGMQLPLIIGGATTSRPHTAVKLAPAYDAPVVHVLDASRAVATVSALLSPTQHGAYVLQVRKDQEDLRASYLERSLRPLLSYTEAKAKRMTIDWQATVGPPPQRTGRNVWQPTLAEVQPYIDWHLFFSAWELRGKFPAILDDPDQGVQARALYDDARQLLDKLKQTKRIQLAAVWGIWPAAAQGDDIVLYRDDAREQPLQRFAMLRQQRVKTNQNPYLSLADFVAPRELGVPDWVGAFAVTAGLGVDALVAEFQADHNDYHAILTKALADRLAEALTECLHQRVRQLWYAPDEQLDSEALIGEQYQGIRPAFGYPACPDHSEKRKLWELLEPEAVGIDLTDNLAMVPASSVSGLYLRHPQAQYFAVGRIGEDQLQDYARRKGVSVAEVQRWLDGSVAE